MFLWKNLTKFPWNEYGAAVFMKKHCHKERGDVLLEYVLLMVFIIVPVVCGSKIVYNANGGTNGSMTSVAMGIEKEDDYGIAGNQLVRMFRRTFMGLALPIP